MDKRSQQWLKQSDYDMDTAEFMVSGERFFYAVFMAHLSVEKALKALFHHKLGQIPPKTHNLIYLLGKIDIHPAEKMGRFITMLNEANLITRYPEDIDKLQNDYSKEVVEKILTQSKEFLQWTKKQF